MARSFTTPARWRIAGPTSTSAISKATTGLDSGSIRITASSSASTRPSGARMASIFTLSLAASFRRRHVRRGVAAAALILVIGLARGASPRFYPDDPLWTDDDRAFDATKVVATEDTNGYDFIVNSFGKPGERRDVRAVNTNSIDEVPDSSWFTNRIGRRDMPLEEIVRGPDRRERVSTEGWIVSGGKGTGVQPGFRMTDPDGQLYQIEVDPPSNPELASAVEIIGTAFYYAFGYSTVEVYLADLDRGALRISDKAMIRDPLSGKRRRMTKDDLDQVFERSARLPNGRYRVLVSKFAPGK